MRLYKFGTVTLPITDVTSDMPINRRSALIDLPNGSFDQDGAESIGQRGTISERLTIWDETGTVIDTTMQALIKELGKGRRVLRALMRDGTTTLQTWAKLRDVRRSTNVVRHDWMQALDISFDQDYPYWLHGADEPAYFDDGNVFDAGWAFDSGNSEQRALTTISDTFTIVNNGGIVIPRGTIIIVPQTGGEFTDITIRNVSTNQELVYAGTVGDGDRLDINFLSKSIYLNFTTDRYAGLSVPSNQLDWMTLQLDDNVIELELTAITGTVDFYWYWSRHYL